jgi:hypothetical protein
MNTFFKTRVDAANWIGDPNVAAFEEDLCRPAYVGQNQGHLTILEKALNADAILSP